MTCWAIIPARGGSKGIPDKNLKEVGGVSLIARAVGAARRASRVTRVIVTSDSRDILDAAARAGAEIVRRPDEIAGDAATSESALLHALEVMSADTDAVSPDVLAFLQCTSPFILPSDVDGVIEMITDGGADTAFTATASHAFIWRNAGDAYGVNHDKARRERRQDRAPEYRETGAVYAFRTSGFLESGHRFFGRSAAHVVPAERAVEIDDPMDLEICRAIAPLVSATDVGSERVDALVMDFDGVLTDDLVHIREDGSESVTCSRGDGLGLTRLSESLGIPVLVLSKERNPVVQARCAKLKVGCLQGVDDKLSVLKRWAVAHEIPLERIAYVGNDVNDIECLRAVGRGIAVSDAHPACRCVADVILTRPGGRGAVREVCESLIQNWSNS